MRTPGSRASRSTWNDVPAGPKRSERIIQKVAPVSSRVSRAWGGFGSSVHRLTRGLRTFIRRPKGVVGWDPHEPTLLGFAIGLLFLGILFPWWGFTRISFDPIRGTKFGETFQFTPWLTTHWYSIVSFAGFSMEATPLVWWDFPRAFPQYNEYATMSAALCGLWTVGLLLAVGALLVRGVPRRRLSGLPTVAEASAAGFIAAALVAAYLGFPSVGRFRSFAGGSGDGPFLWGPGTGLYLSLMALGLIISAAWIGFRVDRNLKAFCWFCFRPVLGPVCEYCHSKQ